MLCVQDSADLNFAEHSRYAGLGRTGKKQLSEGSHGLHLRSKLAVSDLDLALGVLGLEFNALQAGRTSPRRIRPRCGKI